MLEKGFLKPQLSIDRLGKRQFWTGIIIGVGFSFAFSYFFNYSREALRAIAFYDLYILSEKEFKFCDLFVAFFSTSLGFGFTIIYWLKGRNKNIKKRYLKYFAISNSYLITFVSLLAVTRYGSLHSLILIGAFRIDTQWDILNDFGLLFILIPIYIYFAQWNILRLIFKTKNWVLITTVFYCLLSFFLFKTSTVDKDILNNTHYTKYKEHFHFIDTEFMNARKLDVFFNDSTKEILSKRFSNRNFNLVTRLKQAFKTSKVVSIDTLILEKIVIHNMNKQSLWTWRHHARNNLEVNWHYALPEEIYNQIIKQNIESNEVRILFEILNEQIQVFSVGDINWEKWENYSFYETEKSFYKRLILYDTRTIQSRLIQVVDKLKSDKKYERYHYLLPELEFNKNKGRQIYYELKL